MYGQFVDHALDLESSSPSGPHIDIAVPAGTAILHSGGVITLTRDLKRPVTQTLINTPSAA